jgi:hypothetical protein
MGADRTLDLDLGRGVRCGLDFADAAVRELTRKRPGTGCKTRALQKRSPIHTGHGNPVRRRRRGPAAATLPFFLVSSMILPPPEAMSYSFALR